MALNAANMMQLLGMPQTPPPDQAVEEERAAERERALQKVWLKRIASEVEAHSSYRARAKDVYEIFNAKVGSLDQAPYPLYHQVVSVEHAGVYSNQPVPECRPRNDERNPVFREASDILQRAISYYVDDYGFDQTFHRSLDDFLSVGLGVPRVKMDAVVRGDQVQYQSIRWEYVPWRRFGWEPCLTWRTCDWIYFRHPMTRPQIKQRFGREVVGSKDQKNDRSSRNKDEFGAKTVDVYEIWDRKNKKVVFIAKGEQTPLEVNDDPLGLEGFYPIPCPMMTNISDEELIPKPDYDYIEFLDHEINRLTERRRSIMETIKASGAYEQGMSELGEMFELEDGEYQPIIGLASRIAASGGPDGVIYHLPLEEKMRVVQAITEQIAIVRGQIDDILGISDIVRGVTKASESATAQEIKGRWVGVRLSRKRDQVQYTVREMFRIMGQMISKLFTQENLARLTQRQVSEQAMQLLRTDLMSNFVIDIETESTVAKDEFAERETRQAMLMNVAQYSQAVMPLVQAGQMPADLSSAILRSALQPYAKYSRGIDDALATLPDTQQQLQQLTQQMQQLQQQMEMTEQQRAQWEQIARQLQQQATESKAQKESADAGKKQAETAKIYQEIGHDAQFEPPERVTDLALKRAEIKETMADTRRPKLG